MLVWIRKLVYAIFFVMVGVLLVVVTRLWWPLHNQAYDAMRSVYLWQTQSSIQKDKLYKSSHFVVAYPATDKAYAQMVSRDAEHIYGPVTSYMGYKPPAKTLIILEPNEAAIRKAFNWGQGEDAVGVYYQGVIRLLIPDAWIQGNFAVVQETFDASGPMAHEFTHLLLDYQTHGNFPHWYTEGLAQFEDERITGYEWIQSSNNLLTQPLYTISQLTGSFYHLANQALAYREALAMVTYLHTQYGQHTLQFLDHTLAQGYSFQKGLSHFGLTYASLYQKSMQWVKQHPLKWGALD